MLKTIFEWLTSGQTSWLSIVAGIVVSVMIFFFGYGVASNKYKADIAELHADYQAAAAAQAKINQKEAENNAKKLADAISERDAALERAGTLDGTVARLREQAIAFERRLSAAGSDSCKPCKVELARCVSLLAEGAGLAGEGAELSQRVSAKHDAVVKIHGVQ